MDAAIARESLLPGDWIEVKDPNGRVMWSGVYRVESVGRANVRASQRVRFAPDGPIYRQEHTIPFLHVVRRVPAHKVAPLTV